GGFGELYHFDAKADVFPGYVVEKHPALAGKLSCVQTGYFMSSYKLMPQAYFNKVGLKAEDGTFVMSFPTSPDAKVPHIDINADMGTFVYAVSQMPPCKHYIAEVSRPTWPEFLATWGAVTKQRTKYQEITIAQFIAAAPDKPFGEEAGDMFAYCSSPGYDGADATLLKAADLEKAGIACPMTSLEEYFKKQDWTAVLEQ
ncbi:hypothetical protein LOCC1_G008815, partial [Lachnellula occidentalis]